MTTDSQSENPFESPRIVDDEPVQAQLAPRPRRKKKKDLAPTSVVMAMVTALFLTPLVPLGFYFLGGAGVLAAAFNFVFSLLLLMKAPNTWWVGILYYGSLFASFILGNLLCDGCIPLQYMQWGYTGMLANGILLVLFSLPSSRKYYFG